MGPEIGHAAALVLELERAALALAARVDRLEGSRLPAGAQQLAQLWYDPQPAAPAPPCTFAGGVAGCGGLGLPAATLTLTAAGTTLWTGATDAHGLYSGSAALTAATAVQIAVTPGDPFASRFTTPAATPATLAPGPNTLPTITVGPATGYYCSGLVYYPLAATLHLTDSLEGAYTLKNAGTGAGWTAGRRIAYPGCGPCPAGSVAHSFTVAGSLLTSGFGYRPPSGPCPSAAATATSPDVSATLTVTSVAPLLATGAVAAGNGSRWYCGAAASWTLSE
jgi:hypothetical protein